MTSPTDESYVAVQLEALDEMLRRVEDDDLARRFAEFRPQFERLMGRAEEVARLRRSEGRDIGKSSRLLLEWISESLEQLTGLLVALYGEEVVGR